ncbi:MAG: C10 family peptidase [Firmicutes bacterium]|nr:C10 family peptidase [Bacillota bacterium]MCM1401830.1 C10 family peptidase [Bacteroides sp.]MCM1477623.1 C10 family peptidase [Bacteroides sp.]
MKIIVTLVSLLLAWLSAFAAQLTPAEALSRLSSVSNRSSLSLKQLNKYSLAYVAPANTFYAFDCSTGGYIITPADDRCVALLAKVDSGRFNLQEMSPAARWWLETYSDQIGRVIAAGETAENTISIPAIEDLPSLYAKWVPIPPLVSSKWDQGWPYNIFCPEKGGTTCYTGCVATAMAQIVRTIGYFNGSGFRSDNSGDVPVSFDYASANFDFSLMPDEVSINHSGEPMDMVARLMLACGLAVNMNYGVESSGAYSVNTVAGLVDNFGYSADYTVNYLRSRFSTTQWESMLYSELTLGRPVYYSGSNSSSAHAFVIDGYAPAGLWHVNWGWGGVSDGYFVLSVLNPAQQGIGGSSDGYSGSQSMTRVVPPGADPGLRLSELAGCFSVNSDNVLSVKYQTMGKFIYDVNLGAAIVDADNNLVYSTIFWKGQSIGPSSTIRSDKVGSFLNDIKIPQGNYRLYPAFNYGDDTSLSITEPFSDGQLYVEISIDGNGDFVFRSPCVEKDARLVLADVECRRFNSGYSISTPVVIVNNGQKEYLGNVYLDLIPEGSAESVRRVTLNNVSVAPGYNSTIKFSVACVDGSGIPLPAGEYRIQVSDKDGNIIHTQNFPVTVVTGAPPTYQVTLNDISIYNADAIPQQIISGQPWNHTPDTYCSRNIDAEIKVAFYKKGSNMAVKTFLVRSGQITRLNGSMKIDAVNIDVPFGIYEVCYLNGRTQISGRQTVSVGSKSGELYYYPLNDSEVSVAPDPNLAYSGQIEIPSSVTIDGTEYSVSAIARDAFASCNGLSSVIVPASVTSVGANAFALLQNLESVVMRGESFPITLRNYAAPGLNSAADFYVSEPAYDSARETMGEYHNVYVALNSISSGEITVGSDVAEASLGLDPAHEAVNPVFEIEPASEADAAVAQIRGYSLQNGKLMVKVAPLSNGVARFVVSTPQLGVSKAELVVTVENTSSIDEVSEDFPAQIAEGGAGQINVLTSTPVLIYAVDGRLVGRIEAPGIVHLPAGVYVCRCGSQANKVIVR